MADYVTKIRTESGDLPIDYNALANLPTLGSIAAKNIIEKMDLSSEIQSSLNKADTALQKNDKTELEAEITELDKQKQANIKGAASTITSEDLPINCILISDESGKVAVSSVTTTELDCLKGATSSIQTQLENINTSINIGEDKFNLDRIPTIPHENTSGVQAVHIDQTAILEVDADSWSNSSQTVEVDGITTDNTIIVTPAPSSFLEWRNAGVYCSAQEKDKLTFTCETVPTVALTANIVILN